MKTRLPLLILIIVMLHSTGISAQMRGTAPGQPRVVKWLDDSHFIMQSSDENGKTVFVNYDCRNGKSVTLPDYKSDNVLFREALPEGVTPGYDTPVAGDGKSLVFKRNNDLFYYRLGEREPKQLTNDAAEEMNARFSPDNMKIAYTKDRDLYFYDLEEGKEIRLTDDATDRIYNGWASWVYFEEILGRSSRYAAFWWSPDSRKIAYLHTDDNPVPVFNITALEDTDGIHGRLESTPYPKPGDPNPMVKMGVADIYSRATTWIKTDEKTDQYIAWPSWTPDSRRLMIQVLNRDQNDLRFILSDITTGDFTEIYRETRPTWVEFFEDVYVMNDGSGFILRSGRSDWHNLYYYDWSGNMKRELTNFSWKVTAIVHVDETARNVYFTGTGPDALESHFYRVSLNDGKVLQITRGEGSHGISMSPAGSYFVDTWSTIDNPGGLTLIDKKARSVRVLHSEPVPAFDPAKHSRSELVKIKTSDGLFDMPALITYPVNFDQTRQYPVVFTIYGGPDAGYITNRWTGYTPRWYAENGIITINVDHRGSGKFGKIGLDYMHRNFGKWEISDYSDAVKWLRAKPWVDPARMGITGGSYGGYVTCLALTKGADFWTHGIADYSVTDYRLYDNVYTERYMDTPQDNPDGYDAASALTYAGSLKGKLLIRHGDMDDNVHMQNSIWLITKLQDLNKPFEFMVYPGERHGWGGPKRVFMTDESNRFWLRVFFGK